MMRTLGLLHRWAGGLIGLLLAVMGLTGAILVYKDAWVSAPGAGDAQITDTQAVAGTVAKLMADPHTRPESIIFASDSFGLHRLRLADGAGAYADQTGAVTARWEDIWDRPELWLFDLHHYLFAGDVGKVVIGISALIGLFFVVSGVILWWKQRRTFQFRLWPARLSRPAIIRQHRDIGIVLAPLLLLSFLTGIMLTLKPVSNLLLSPFSSAAEMAAASARPAVKGGSLADGFDWAGLLVTAKTRFPDAEFRVLAAPRRPGDLISLRMRQPTEWLPNGRTTLWFAPEDGRLVEARDALSLPLGSRVFNLAYPIHAAKVGGLAWKLAMTASGLGLALLGTLTVWSFWFHRTVRRPSATAAEAG